MFGLILCGVITVLLLLKASKYVVNISKRLQVVIKHVISSSQKDPLPTVPGPKPSWLAGNLVEYFKLGQHQAFKHWAKLYGPVVKYYQGSQPIVVVSDPTCIRQFTSRCSNRHPIPYLETGEEERFNKMFVLFSRGAWWRSLRAAWQPYFHTASLQRFVPLMDGAAGRMAAILEDHAGKDTAVDINRLFGDLTMSVVGSTAFGVDFKTQERKQASKTPAATQHKQGTANYEYEAEAKSLVEAAQVFFETSGPAIMENPYALLLLIFPSKAALIRRVANIFPTGSYKRALQSRKAVKSITQTLLNNARKQQKEGTAPAGAGKGKEVVGGKPSGVAPGSFLALMAKATNKETGTLFSDMEVINQAYGFLLAAYETTASALTCATFLVATHPDVRVKVQAELDAFGKNKTPTHDDIEISQFPYIEAVFKEALRMYPPVPLLARESDKDMEVGGHKLPAGTWLQASVYCLHRDSKYWTNPESFIPERFIPDSSHYKESELLAYMPWGEGPRSCVGVKFATQEFMLAFIHLHQRFTFTAANNTAEKAGLETSITGTSVKHQHHGEKALGMKAALTLAPAFPVMMTVRRKK